MFVLRYARTVLAAVVLAMLVSWIGFQGAEVQASDADDGKWDAPFEWGPPQLPKSIPIHMVVLPNGKVMTWNNPGDDGSDEGDISRADTPIVLWDPVSKAFEAGPTLIGTDIFCAGHALMSDGRVFVGGGNEDIASGHQGSDNANIYTPGGGWQTNLDPMNARRWYPTVTTLADRRILVTSGDKVTGERNNFPQAWNPATGLWATYPEKAVSLYPWMYVTRHTAAGWDGAYLAGEKKDAWYLNTNGGGSWVEANDMLIDHEKGSSVMYNMGRILNMGGFYYVNNLPVTTARAEIVNLSATNPQWQEVTSMNHARKDHNATILADGNVFVNGGIDGTGAQVDIPELYVLPAGTPVWDDMAVPQPRCPDCPPHKRAYHSTAVLLPDGSVLVGGGTGGTGDDSKTAEIYKPPYFFKGARPVITSPHPPVTYDETVNITYTPTGQTITKVLWIRLSSVTHGFNENQRLNTLTILSGGTGGSISVKTPLAAYQSPPGHYMMFIVNSAGVPSEAKIVQIQ